MEKLTQILANELRRYQPHTNCRRAVDRVIDECIEAGLITDLSPLSAVEPSYLKRKAVPASFHEALDDVKHGRFVTMEVALNEKPPEPACWMCKGTGMVMRDTPEKKHPMPCPRCHEPPRLKPYAK